MPKRKPHYETLGVDERASKDDIKKAYRRKIKAVHPDATRAPLEPEKMNQIVKAYKTLHDDDARARYDETGDDSPVDDIASKINQIVVFAFQKAISIPLTMQPRSILERAKNSIDAVIQSKKTDLRDHAEKVRHLKNLQGRVKRKKGKNLYDELIESHLRNFGVAVRHITAEKELYEAAMKHLEEYGEDVPPDSYQRLFTANTSTATTCG